MFPSNSAVLAAFRNSSGNWIVMSVHDYLTKAGDSFQEKVDGALNYLAEGATN